MKDQAKNIDDDNISQEAYLERIDTILHGYFDYMVEDLEKEHRFAGEECSRTFYMLVNYFLEKKQMQVQDIEPSHIMEFLAEYLVNRERLRNHEEFQRNIVNIKRTFNFFYRQGLVDDAFIHELESTLEKVDTLTDSLLGRSGDPISEQRRLLSIPSLPAPSSKKKDGD